MLSRRYFILKPIEGLYVPLNNGAGDFKYSLPFKRSACFYMIITRGFLNVFNTRTL